MRAARACNAGSKRAMFALTWRSCAQRRAAPRRLHPPVLAEPRLQCAADRCASGDRFALLSHISAAHASCAAGRHKLDSSDRERQPGSAAGRQIARVRIDVARMTQRSGRRSCGICPVLSACVGTRVGRTGSVADLRQSNRGAHRCLALDILIGYELAVPYPSGRGRARGQRRGTFPSLRQCAPPGASRLALSVPSGKAFS